MSEKMPLGVFTSIWTDFAERLQAVRDIGVHTVQAHVPPPQMRTAEEVEKAKNTLSQAGVELSLVFCGFAGDRYDTIQIVRDTVGLCPPATRAERMPDVMQTADYAAALGVPGIGMHIGFLSEDPNSKEFADVAAAARQICDYCADLGMRLHLETGQETAETLLEFIRAVDRASLAVNFDPANMILYGSGEPIEALRKVGRYVRSVHCKDATWSDRPGEAWGVETPLGEGDVGMEDFVRTLLEVGYEGPLTIEREVSGEQQMRDIKKAVDRLTALKAKLLH